MIKYLASIFFILFLIVAGNQLRYLRIGKFQLQFTPPRFECGTLEKWSYCVFDGENVDTNHHLYIFHGKDQNVLSWLDRDFYSGLLQQYWQDQKINPPRVIMVSLGPVWLLTPTYKNLQQSSIEQINTSLRQEIERTWGAPQKRTLLGVSMGALNALTYTLSFPQDFSKVAILCPPLYQISPHASWKELHQFLLDSGAQLRSLITLLGIGQYYFPTEKDWSEFSPLERLSKATAHWPQFYVSTGVRDEFGNYQGVVSLVHLLRQQGAEVDWHSNSGDHCSIDTLSLANFIGS